MKQMLGLRVGLTFKLFMVSWLFGVCLPLMAVEQRVYPPDDGIDLGDDFGTNVAVSGSWAVAGVPLDRRDGYSKVGSAYIMQRVAGVWKFQSKLSLPPDKLDGQTQFGQSVAIFDDLVAVTANHSRTGACAIYLYRRTSSVWVFEAELSGPQSRFTRSSLVLGNGRVVSGCGLNASAQSVLCHRLTETGWQEEQIIQRPVVGFSFDAFGSSIALDGEVLLIGSPGLPGGSSSVGSVHEYRFISGVWQRSRSFQSPLPVSGDEFGVCVKLAAGRALIGAGNRGSQLRANGGSVYLYQVSDSPWTMLRSFGGDQTLRVEDDGDLSLSETRALFISRSSNTTKELQISGQPASDWVLRTVSLPEGFRGGPVTSLAVQADVGLVGFDKQSGNSAGNLTGKFVELSGASNFVAGAVVVPSNTHQPEAAHFGSSVAIEGDLSAFATHGYRDSEGRYLGTVCIVERRSGIWGVVKTMEVPPQSNIWNSSYGSKVVVSGNRVVVTEPSYSWDYTPREGRVFVYERGANGLWPSEPSIVIRSPHGSVAGVAFGGSCVISGDRLAVSEVVIAEKVCRVRLYRISGGQAVQIGVIEKQGDLETNDFGNALALDNNWLAVSNALAKGTGFSRGEVILYDLNGDGSKLAATVRSQSKNPAASFGLDVRLDGGVLVVKSGGYHSQWVETFQGAGGKWLPLSAIPQPVSGNMAVALKSMSLDAGKLLLCTTLETRLYRRDSAGWQFLYAVPLQESVYDLQAAFHGDSIMFSGGITQGVMFRPTSNIIAGDGVLAGNNIVSSVTGGVDLGELLVGTDTQVTVPVKNLGPRPLVLKQVIGTSSGTNPSSLTKLDFKPVTLASGESTQVVVTLHPSVPGSYSVYLNVIHDDASLGEIFFGLYHTAVAVPIAPSMNEREPARLVALGESVLLETSIQGTRGYTCRWFKDGRFLSGQQHPVLHIPKAKPSDAGRYRLEVRRAGFPLVQCEMSLGVFDRQFIERQFQSDKPLNFHLPVWGPGIQVRWDVEESWFARGTRTPTLNIHRAEQLIQSTPHQLSASVTMDWTEVTGFWGVLHLVRKPVIYVNAPHDVVLGQDLTLSVSIESAVGGVITVDGLPPGLAYSPIGFGINGTPTKVGFYRFTVRGRNNDGEAVPVIREIRVVATPEEVELYYGPSTTMVGAVSIPLPPLQEIERPGLLSVQTTSGIGFTGELRLDTVTRRFSGSWGPHDGSGHRTAKLPLTTFLGYKQVMLILEQNYLNDDEVPSMVCGFEVVPFEGDASQVNGVELRPVVRSSKEVPGVITGKYSFLLQPVDASLPHVEPTGTGFGSMNISESMRATGVGTLPDGSGFTFSMPILRTVPDGDSWLIPLVHYLGDGGYISGWVGWETTSNPFVLGKLLGQLNMTRPPKPGARLYPEGYLNKTIQLIGARYYLPVSLPVLPAPGSERSQVRLIFDNGNESFTLPLTEPIQASANFTTDLRASVLAPNPHGIRLDVYSPTGFFTGSFTTNDLLPGSETRRQSRTVNYRGMIIPDLHMGEGLFLLQQLPDPTAAPPVISGNARIHTGRVHLE